jgi:hypothetical protein
MECLPGGVPAKSPVSGSARGFQRFPSSSHDPLAMQKVVGSSPIIRSPNSR